MSALATYVWKEWREQRHIVITVLALATAAAFTLALTLPESFAQSPTFVSKITSACVLIVLVAIGSDTFAAERRSNRIALLRRVPAGLTVVLTAKLVLLVAAMVAAGAWSYGMTVLAQQTYFESVRAPDMLRVGWNVLAIPLAALACWLVAVSAWFQRSASAVLCATVVAGVAGLLPIGLLLVPMPKRDWPAYVETAFLVAVPAAFALAVISTIYGLRRADRRPWRWGATATAVAALPLMWSGVSTFASWHGIDPASPTFVIAPGGLLGADARHAFLNVTDSRWGRSTRPWRSIVVDLETGVWKRYGSQGGAFVSIGFLEPGGGWGRHGLHELVVYVRPGKEKILSRCILDASSAEVLDDSPTLAAPLHLRDRVRDARRAVTPHWLPNGGRVSADRYLIEISEPNGSVKHFAVPDGYRPSWRRGLGFALCRIADLSHHETFDCTRRRVIEIPQEHRKKERYVRATGWLVGTRTEGWSLWNPDTGRTSPVPGLEDGDQLVDCLASGVLFVRSRGGTLFLIDPDHGTRRSVRFEDGSVAVAQNLDHSHVEPRRTPCGHPVFFCAIGSDWEGWIVRLDEANAVLAGARVPSFTSFLACPDEDSAIVHTKRQLLRVAFGSDEREVLFPR